MIALAPTLPLQTLARALEDSTPVSEFAEPAETLELSIVMPCLNEARTVGECVAEAVTFLRTRGIDGEVVVSDNGSTDGSQAIARQAGARVVAAEGRGYGRALQAGIRAACGRFVIMGDSDLSYDFSNLDGFLTRLRAGDQLVMGNRFRGGIAARAMPFLHRYLGNPVLSYIGRLFFGGGIHDFHCGLRGFERASILKIAPQSPGMEFASELVIRALQQDLRVNEVPTTLRRDGRDRPPHLRTWRDGWRHLRLMMFYCPRWLFIFPGLCCALSGMIGTVSLFFGPIWLGRARLDAGTMGVFGLVWLVGMTLLSFGVCARQMAGHLKLLPPKAVLDRLVGSNFLEPALLAALGTLLLGVGLLGYDLFMWSRNGFGALEPEVHLRRIIMGSTLVCLAIQGASACFYLGLLHTAQMRSRPPAMIVVVGSGPAGAACASALVGQGHRVTMLDFGRTADPAATALATRLQPLSNPERRRVAAEEDRSQVSAKGLARKTQFNSDHAYTPPPGWPLTADPTRVGLEPSFALGGFSGVWGASMLPYAENDLAGWPIGTEDLAAHFRAALRLTRLAADDTGTLGARYPLYANHAGPLPAGKQAAKFYERLGRHEAELTRHGFLYGRARLAVETQADAARHCRRCGLCMSGCPDGAIYDSTTTVRDLQATGLLDYRPGVLVRRVTEEGGQVRIAVETGPDGETSTLTAERVFLAGGPIPTTRLLMESAGWHGREVYLQDSQYFLLPLLLWASAPGTTTEDAHTLAQVFIEILDPTVSAHTVHLQVYGYNPQIGAAVRKALGVAGWAVPALARLLAERLLVFQGYLHSSESSRLRLRLDTLGGAELSAEENPATARVISRAVAKLRRHPSALGGLPVSPMLVRGTTGRGFHSGGSFPMSAQPGERQSDLWGRPFGWQRIHAVDSTIFPTIPATTITLNVMANAHRIGSAFASYSHP